VSAPSTVQWLRTAVSRIAVGSGRRAAYLAAWVVHRVRLVWARATGWLSEGEGIGWLLRLAALLIVAVVLRKLATAITLGIYRPIADGGAPLLCWGAAICWTVSAYRAGADGWKPKRPPAPEPPAADEKTEAREDPPATEWKPSGPLPVSPTALVAAVRDIGTPNAQLVPLAAHLGTNTDTVRATAAGMGWGVKDVRMAGRSSTHGLRWDECPSPSEVRPSSTVVGAGQPADDNDDDTDEKGLRKGFRVKPIGLSGSVVYDPAETVRHHPVRDH
jgi:hypothetical protein